MPCRLDRLEYALNMTIRSDDERRAVDAHILTTHKFLFLPNPVSLSDLMLNIGEQDIRQLVLGFEFGLFGNAIGRDADDDGFRLKLLELVAKLASFRRSTGSVGFWIKPENYRFAALLR